MEATDARGRTPLHIAAARQSNGDGGGLSVGRLIVAVLGADVGAVANDGWTPLHNAACRGLCTAARLLVARAGADVMARD